jgi:hypothetical protein
MKRDIEGIINTAADGMHGHLHAQVIFTFRKDSSIPIDSSHSELRDEHESSTRNYINSVQPVVFRFMAYCYFCCSVTLLVVRVFRNRCLVRGQCASH